MGQFTVKAVSKDGESITLPFFAKTASQAIVAAEVLKKHAATKTFAELFELHYDEADYVKAAA